MGVYKDISIPDELDCVIHQMREVDGYREELSSLGQQWDLLTILGQMSGDGIDMSATREAFKQLTGDLLSNLGLETLRKVLRKLTAKAQVAVDIVVRNLFERTADIGFLATDHNIRDYLRDGGEQAVLEARFREYIAKYSVYDNVILIGIDGSIRAQIDHTNGLTSTTDPIVGDCLRTSNAYVECYRETELAPQFHRKLLYAFRVTETDDPRSKALGVLVLCFRFENEMEGVFKNLMGANDWECITLLDGEGEVIASGDKYQIPVGAKVEFVLDQPFKVVKFAGREYLSKSCATKGYQGYMGPGWYGHVMVALDQAFDVRADPSHAIAAPPVMRAVLASQRLFSPDIRRIPRDAERIQRDLDRSVWNGNVRQESIAHEENDQGQANANKVLLWEISKTGARTKSVFERSITNLRTTVVSSILHDVHFMASLAIDIMDRNLYERANDCRWWALTQSFRSIMSKHTITAGDQKSMTETLSYINSLYTVYSNIFVFDRSGTVLAVSNPENQGLVGRPVEGRWVQDTLSNHQSQWYTASSFEESNLYNEQRTYIYAAPITAAHDVRRNVGGIGVVFDSTPQFHAMLDDCLPRTDDGVVIADAFALFVDRLGHVIASTRPDIAIGEKFAIDSATLNLPAGQGSSSIFPFKGHYYAMGVHASSGYREYKGPNDPYTNDVRAVVFIPLSEAVEMVERAGSKDALASSVKTSNRVAGAKQVEIATFFIGEHWIGVNAQWVLEAVSMDFISRVPHAPSGLKGVMKLRDTVLPVMSVHEKVGRNIKFEDEETQIVVINTSLGPWGMIVDRLGPIPTVDPNQIDTDSAVVKRAGSYVSGLVKPAPGSAWPRLLIVVDPQELRKTLLSLEGEEFLANLE